MADRLIRPAADWAGLRAGFRWPNLPRFNIAEEACDRWARSEPDRIALIHPQADDRVRAYSYKELSRLSNKLANVFRGTGLNEGGRVAILLPQVPEVVLTHMAVYKSGAIAVPLFTLFGEDGLRYRLQNAGAEILVTDHANLPKIMAIRDDLPDLRAIFCIDGDGDGGARDFWASMLTGRDRFDAADTTPDTPALLVYTSGTTGPPKGALHGHRVLLGHLPGVETHHDMFPQPGDVAWTPADWAWLGGLANILLPSLYHGVPVVSSRAGRFDPEAAYALIRRHNVRNIFMPPTALRFLRAAPEPGPLGLRSIGSGGEALGGDLLDWAKGALGVTINEFYGSTECNLVLGNAHTLFEPRPGSMGKPVPGSEVAVIDAAGNPLPPGEAGEIAVKRGDMAMFLEYWNAPEKTAEKFSGDWMRMGDEGWVDADGYFHFKSRTDDVITTSGYRVGPAEIEECLTGHPDVTMAAAIGIPDAERGEVVKAFVVLREGATLNEAALIERVRSRISPHVAPKQVAAIESLPITATGKIMRRELKER